MFQYALHDSASCVGSKSGGFLCGFWYEIWVEWERNYSRSIQKSRQPLPLHKPLCEVEMGFIYLLNPLHTPLPFVFKHSNFVCTSTTAPYLPPLFCFTTRITDSRPCLRNLSPEIRFAYISFRHVVFLTFQSLLQCLQLSQRYCQQITYATSSRICMRTALLPMLRGSLVNTGKCRN